MVLVRSRTCRVDVTLQRVSSSSTGKRADRPRRSLACITINIRPALRHRADDRTLTDLDDDFSKWGWLGVLGLIGLWASQVEIAPLTKRDREFSRAH
jgi:hypothetical protein